MDSLKGTIVGLAGAMPMPSELAENGWSELDIRMTVLSIVEGILRSGGRIVHGSHPTYVPLIKAVVRDRLVFSNSDKPVIMYVVRPYLSAGEEDLLQEEHGWYADLHMIGSISTPQKEALHEMRKEMIHKIDALVCIGGKGVRPDVPEPGVAVEAGLAAAGKKPVYLAAAVGGFTTYLYGKHPEVRSVENGLTKEEDDHLARTSDPAELTDLILRGLHNLPKKLG